MYEEICENRVSAKGYDGVTNYPIYVSVVRKRGDKIEVLFESAVFAPENLCSIPPHLKDACKEAPSAYLVERMKNQAISAMT